MKLARNRCMFFASWTGAAITASGTVTPSGTGITAAAFIETTGLGTFGTKVSNTSGTYEFTYNGTAWTYKGTTVTLSEYGLTVTEATGGALSGDKITVNYIASSGGWEAIGKDNDDLSKELNADTESKKNVLGETSFEHKGYEPQVSVDPYYMDPARLMYAHLKDIAQKEAYSEEECLGYFAEAFFESADEANHTMTGYCYVRRAWIVPQSVGGDTAGFAIPFNVNPVGGMEKKAITYDMLTNTATVTALS